MRYKIKKVRNNCTVMKTKTKRKNMSKEMNKVRISIRSFPINWKQHLRRYQAQKTDSKL